MSSENRLEGSVRSTALFALATLEAWTTAAALFILFRRMPFGGGLLENAYYPALCSVLPWVAGCMFWFKVRRKGKEGKLDREATTFCYIIINNLLILTYIVVLLIGQVLFWAVPRVK